MQAGGYTRNDGAVEFSTRVRALLPDEGLVVDFGAGRGEACEDDVPFRRWLQDLRAPGRTVVGVDIDPVVADNPGLDEAHVLDGPRLPFADGSVALVVARSVLEHVERPEEVAGELGRVLAPGGWLCAMTPNRHGYISIGARLVPNRAHARVLGHLQPTREERDVFPTVYAMNTRATLRALFPEPTYEHATYGFNVDPVYFQRVPRLGGVVARLGGLLPEALAPILMVFIRKAR